MPLMIPLFDEHHANAELRKKPGKWFWVRMPTRMDSLSRQRLMQTPEGRQAFAVYVHLVEIAAKDEPRGVLADERGPISIEDVALMTAIPSEVLQQGIETLSAPGVGWVCDSRSIGNEKESSLPPTKLLNSELSGEGGAGGNPDGFNAFWRDLPAANQIGKGGARRAYDDAIKAGVTAEEIRGGVKAFAAAEKRRRSTQGKDYIARKPENWLRDEGWHDRGPDATTSRPAEKVRALSTEEARALAQRRRDEQMKRETAGAGGAR